ncbi:uncharacterized protein LOC121255015 [Juglans microcarpa x Juglans regia]|uniref:uncharacterized protein LOC121255015 n=1 Tax=Juglans microcarpa x Juglans regia TaxID=2249226 RepID=UPI001B7F5C30|nr:uncharacterized protein LOC121255015 [Juglans microcarpa x Juglans regia]
MEPMKFVCLLLVLISSTTAWLSLAHPSRVSKDTKAAGKEAANASVSSAKGLLEDESWPVSTAFTNKKIIKGRRMQAMGNNIVKQDRKKEHAGAVAGRRTTSNISSSNQVGGKYEGHEEGYENGGSTSSSSSVEHEQNVYRSSEQIDDEAAGFVAFNADYHEPRHHPPKNN